jgi:hypothetical protein
MSQRVSGYARIPHERYETVEPWPVLALLRELLTIGPVWDPCDDGDGHLVATLRRAGIKAIGTGSDFLRMTAPPMSDVNDIVTNPPLGPARRGELAIAFIRHALSLPVRRIAMLLPSDFDSAITRQDVFRFCPAFTGKLGLLNRIRWIAGSTGSPSTNHAWFLWDRTNVGPPCIRYVPRQEVDDTSPESKFAGKRSPASSPSMAMERVDHGVTVVLLNESEKAKLT